MDLVQSLEDWLSTIAKLPEPLKFAKRRLFDPNIFEEVTIPHWIVIYITFKMTKNHLIWSSVKLSSSKWVKSLRGTEDFSVVESAVDKGRILFDLTDFGLGGEFGLDNDSFQISSGRFSVIITLFIELSCLGPWFGLSPAYLKVDESSLWIFWTKVEVVYSGRKIRNLSFALLYKQEQPMMSTEKLR